MDKELVEEDMYSSHICNEKVNKVVDSMDKLA
jgi:hypothetical protein